MTGFGEVARAYLGAHAIDPDLAAACGVREVRGGLAFPYVAPDGSSFDRLRSLNGAGAKVKQPPGRPLTPWWPLGRPPGAEAVLVCEGESDALAALEPLAESRFAATAVVAVPGTGFPAGRLPEQLGEVGARDAYLVFDADEAGRGYAEKAAGALREAGIRPVVVELEDGADLAETLARVDDRPGWIDQALADAEAAGDSVAASVEPRESAPEQRLREAGVLEDGRTFYAAKGAAAAGFLVERLWAEGGAGWIAGEPKTLKTWLVCELIIAITTGRPAFGEFACERPGRVLYAAEEGNRRRFQERLAGLCNAYGVPLADVQANLDVIWRQHVDLLDGAWQRDLAAIAPAYRAIFLDPFRDMHDADEDRVHQVKPVLDFLRRLQEQGPAVAAVMHLRKARDGDNKIRAGQRVAGSRHFHSFLDSALYLDPEKGGEEDGPVKLTIEHRDEEAIAPFVFELEAEGTADAPDFRLRAETETAALRGRRGEQREKAVEAARALGPTTKTELAKALGVQRQAGLAVVKDCLDQGLLERSDDGRKVLAASEPDSAVPEGREPAGTEALPIAENPHGEAA